MTKKVWQEGSIFADRYQIVKLIAEGGMSYVFQARDLFLSHRLVALKILKPSLTISENWLQREASALTSLKHPHIPIVYDFIREEPCLVMEWLEGVTLAQTATRRQLPELLALFIQVAEALVYLHELPAPIIHRDIKPANIMIDSQGQVKIIDFGICKFAILEREERELNLGTPGFASPEQLRGERTTTLSDVYSFGMLICYTCSIGSFQAPALDENIEHWLSRKYAHLPKTLLNLIAACIQTDPQYRLPSMKEAYLLLNDMLTKMHSNESHHVWSNGPLKQYLPRKVKIKAIAALDRKAGATTISMAYAQSFLSKNKEQTLTLVEHPFEEANLLMSYLQYYVDNKEPNHSMYHSIQAGCVQFYIQHQLFHYEASERLQYFLQLIQQIDTDIVIVDVSFHFLTLYELGLLSMFDEVIVVVSPDVYCMNEHQLLKRLNVLSEVKTPLKLIMNKVIKKQSFDFITSLLPISSVKVIPFISTRSMIKMKYNGRWLHPYSHEMRQIRKSLLSLNRYLD